MGLMDYEKVLKRYWGYQSFRGIQLEVIESIGEGRDTLALMPTGGGKSLCFQVPAMTLQGLCLVITPLIALMNDQVTALRRRNISAEAIYTGMSRDEIIRKLENCVFGAVKFLYISPERLFSPLFKTKLQHIDVALIAVDEAHCISQWGYDFRPSYLQIAAVRHMIARQAPVLALTATATPSVADDIMDKLEFRKGRLIKMSFRRDNLAYVVRKAEDKIREMKHILDSVPGSAIVYARSRRCTIETARYLKDNGIDAVYYHAGLTKEEKDSRQKEWTEGKRRVMVATNAFGMGIDKADVRMVIHIDTPNSIEEYFQEAGRSGRDGKRAYAVLIWDNGDIKKLRKRVSDAFPPKETVKDIYDELAYFYELAVGDGYGILRSFDINSFSRAYHRFPTTVHSALKILSYAGYIDYDSQNDNASRVRFILERDELYNLHPVTAVENRVITTLLRCYSGIFTRHANVDPAYVALECALNEHEVYDTLAALSKRGIIEFIPRSDLPTIRYLCSRAAHNDIVLPKSCYEQRLKIYRQRIEAMIRYVTADDICRSRQLLNYFGEKKSGDCHICDVCLSRNSRYIKSLVSDAEDRILSLLSDAESHYVTELSRIALPSDIVDEALERLLREEKINFDEGMISAKKNTPR